MTEGLSDRWMVVPGPPRRALLAASTLLCALLVPSATAAVTPRPAPTLNWELITVTATGTRPVHDIYVTSTMVLDRLPGQAMIGGFGFAYPANHDHLVTAANYGGGPQRLAASAGGIRWSVETGSGQGQDSLTDGAFMQNYMAPGSTVYYVSFFPGARITRTGVAKVSHRDGSVRVQRTLGAGAQALRALDAADQGEGVDAEGSTLADSTYAVQTSRGLAGAFVDGDMKGTTGGRRQSWTAPDGTGGTSAYGATPAAEAGQGPGALGFAGPPGSWTFSDTVAEHHTDAQLICAWAPIGPAWQAFAVDRSGLPV